MGCMWSDDKKHSPPLSTRAIYSLIFQKEDWTINNNRSKSDSEISYKEASPPREIK